jgi:hypothetical protein
VYDWRLADGITVTGEAGRARGAGRDLPRVYIVVELESQVKDMYRQVAREEEVEVRRRAPSRSAVRRRANERAACAATALPTSRSGCVER